MNGLKLSHTTCTIEQSDTSPPGHFSSYRSCLDDKEDAEGFTDLLMGYTEPTSYSGVNARAKSVFWAIEFGISMLHHV